MFGQNVAEKYALAVRKIFDYASILCGYTEFLMCFSFQLQEYWFTHSMMSSIHSRGDYN